MYHILIGPNLILDGIDGMEDDGSLFHPPAGDRAMKADIDFAGSIPDSRGINLYRADRDAAAL